MLVKEGMTTEVWTVGAGATLDDAARLMWDHDIGAVPVVDDQGNAIGMITDRDICMAAYTQGKPLHELAVAPVMATQLITCRADDPISRAEELMRTGQVRRLPVLDGSNQVIGMFSLNDLARVARRTGGRNGVKADEVTVVLADIGAPRTPVTASA